MKRTRALGALTCAALIVAACGSDDEDEPAASEAGSDATAGEDAADQATTVAGDDGAADRETVTLRIESWLTPDQQRWDEVLIPAFEEAHPGIELSYEPTTGTEYDAALRTRLDGGAAGDIITCRAFDGSLELFNEGYLAPLDDLPGIENFPDSALTAWRTDDGSSQFCVPFAGSIHGFIYNADAFAELGLEEPTTQDEFMAVLEAIAADGTYVPLAMGAADTWTVGSMGYENIAPNYYGGEQGRLGLLDGTKKVTDPEFVEPFEVLASWRPYLADGFEAVAYTDAQQLFTLGRAAIYPAGSWEIAGFNDAVDFEMGFFKAPLAEPGQETCYTNFHTDAGFGANAASEHPEAARAFLEWTTTPEFASLAGNTLVGQVPLTSAEIEIQDPLLAEFVASTEECETTIRFTYQRLSRGEPSSTTVEWNLSTEVLKGTKEPADAAAELQEVIDATLAAG